VQLEEIPGQHPWPSAAHSANALPAHEFHYSSLEDLPADADFACHVTRGKGIQHQQDAYLYRNLVASYTHLRNTPTNPWVKRFLQFVQAHKRANSEVITNALRAGT
jgi:cobyrinic acid a,c-diamide synthase